MRYCIMLLVAITAILFTGCTNTNKDTSPPSEQSDNKVNVQQTVPAKRNIDNPKQVADRLEKLAKSTPQVIDATCVVIGNTAIVGINISGDMERARVGTIKYSVAEALRKDPYGVDAIVTADMDIRNRLLEIRSDIRNGRPISGFANELSDIIGRIMPQLPRNMVPSDKPPAKTKDHNRLKNKSM